MSKLKCENKNHFGENPKSVFRVNQKGNVSYWCLGCIKKLEPELMKGVNEDSILDVVDIINKLSSKIKIK